MAEELGVAALRVEVDLSGLKQGLDQARQQIDSFTNKPITARTARGTAAAATGGSIDRDTVRRFNLRGFTAALNSIADDIENIRTARQLNISSSWNKALETFSEITEELQSISTGKRLNIRASWDKALTSLQDISEDLRALDTGKKLNIRSSWNAALAQLQEVDAEIKAVQSGKQLNIKTSWNAALATLTEIDQELKALQAGRQLNLANNWRTALATLNEIDAEIKAISGAKRINLNSSWSLALQQLNETKTDIDSVAKAKKINIASSWTKFLGQLADVKQDIDAASALRATERSNRRQAKIEGIRDYVSTGGRDTSILQGTQAFARPNAEAIKAEQALQRERLRTADVTKQAAVKEKGFLGGRGKDVISNALIGGAFPLLFGQGAGASAGGLLGGAAGGLLGGQFGFGGSLIGTAIGAQFDAAVQQLQTLGTALKDPIGSFGALQEAALLSSKGVERNAEALIAAGRQEEAAALIRADITSRFGDLGEAQALTASLDDLKRSFAELSVSLIQELGPALTEAASGLAAFISKLNLIPQQQAGEVIQQAKGFIGSDPSRQAEFNKLFAAEGGTYGASGKFSSDSIGAAVRASEKLLEINGQLTEQQKLQAAAAAQTTDDITRRQQLQALERDSIIAAAAGDKERLLYIKQQQLALEETAALNALPQDASIKREALKLEYANKRLDIEQQIANLPQKGSLADLNQQLDQARRALETTNPNAANFSTLQQQYQNQLAARNRVQDIISPQPLGAPGAYEKLLRSQVESERNVKAKLDNASEIRKQLIDAGKQLREQIVSASKAIEGTLRGNYDFLRSDIQKQVLARAQSEINTTIFDPAKIGSNVGNIFRAADASNAIVESRQAAETARTQLATNQTNLAENTKELTSLRNEMTALREKNWNVRVAVNAATGSSTVNMG